MASPESRVASASEIRVGTLERPFFLDPRAAERGRNREATLKQRYADSDIKKGSVDLGHHTRGHTRYALGTHTH